MRRFYIYLISLVFIGSAIPTFAKTIKISAVPEAPQKTYPLQDVRLPLSQWDSDNQEKRDNLSHITTIFSLYNTRQVEIDLGPAQFEITFPLF